MAPCGVAIAERWLSLLLVREFGPYVYPLMDDIGPYMYPLNLNGYMGPYVNPLRESIGYVIPPSSYKPTEVLSHVLWVHLSPQETKYSESTI